MGMFDKGPGYTVTDLVYWAGFMAGALISYLVLVRWLQVEMHQLVQLLVTIGCGVALGFICERIYTLSRRRGPGDGPPK